MRICADIAFKHARAAATIDRCAKPPVIDSGKWRNGCAASNSFRRALSISGVVKKAFPAASLCPDTPVRAVPAA